MVCGNKRHNKVLRKDFCGGFVSQEAGFPSPLESLAIQFEREVLEISALIDMINVAICEERPTE